jgi:hypothetical protein
MHVPPWHRALQRFNTLPVRHRLWAIGSFQGRNQHRVILGMFAATPPRNVDPNR